MIPHRPLVIEPAYTSFTPSRVRHDGSIATSFHPKNPQDTVEPASSTGSEAPPGRGELFAAAVAALASDHPFAERVALAPALQANAARRIQSRACNFGLRGGIAQDSSGREDFMAADPVSAAGTRGSPAMRAARSLRRAQEARALRLVRENLLTPSLAQLEAARTVFLADEVNTTRGSVIANNLWLRMQRLQADLPGVVIHCKLDTRAHTMSFYYKDNGMEQLLCGQELLPHEEDFCAILFKDSVTSDLTQVLHALHHGFMSEFAVVPKGAEAGVELHLIANKAWFVYRESDNKILEIFRLPEFDIAGPEGYSKRVAAIDWASSSVIELRRTETALLQNSQRRHRRPSLTTTEMQRTGGLHGVSVYKLGCGNDDSEVWLTPLGSRLLALPDLATMRYAAKSLTDLHRSNGAHCDVKPLNLLLALKPRVFTPESPKPHARYKVAVVDRNSADDSQAEDAVQSDIVVLLSPASEDVTSVPFKLYLRGIDGKFTEIPEAAYSFNPELAQALAKTVKETNLAQQQIMLEDLAWRFKRFFVTRGLLPNGEFQGQVVDFWRAVPPRPIDDATASLAERCHMALESFQECFSAITPQYTVDTLYEEFFHIKLVLNSLNANKPYDRLSVGEQEIIKRYMTEEVYRSCATDIGQRQELMLKLACDGIKIAQFSDVFAFYLSLLETQGYTLHYKLATINGLSCGLPVCPLHPTRDVQQEIFARIMAQGINITCEEFERQQEIFRSFVARFVALEQLSSGAKPQPFFRNFMNNPLGVYYRSHLNGKPIPRFAEIIPQLA